MLSAKKQRKLKWIYWAPWKSSRNPFFVVTFTHTSRCKRGNMWATLASLMFFFFGRWDDIKQETGELQFLCMRNISHFIRDENEFLRIYHRMIAHSMGINQNYLSSSSALSYEHWTEGGKAAFVDFNCSFCCKLSGNTISQVETHRAEILTSWCFVFGFSCFSFCVAEIPSNLCEWWQSQENDDDDWARKKEKAENGQGKNLI